MSKSAESMQIENFETVVLPHLPPATVDVTGWLKERGFFKAPASTKYHGTWEGGLYCHSLSVMNTLNKLTEDNHLRWQRPESPWLVGIFHDLCKTDQYDRNPKEMMVGEPHYIYNDKTLFKGHGEKSVMLLSTLFQLTEEEVACIRYHMGAFTEKEQWNDYTRAIHAYPNVLWTHHADMIATHIFDV